MQDTDNWSPSFQLKIPDGEDRERSVCTRCGFIDYQNPRVVVGSVATDDQGRILLCKRAIAPRTGWWTLPAGYLEMGEGPLSGARREAHEEAEADLQIDCLLGIYSIVRISQIQLIYRASLLNPKDVRPGPESEEVALVPYEDIPWTDLAFPSVVWALRDWHDTRDQAGFPPRSNPPEGL
jgi:ADP-ribose pyrophosphatase YjhB (NUDIX family)